MFDFLYGSTPASFASPYSIQESVERLRATVSGFLGNDWPEGEISEDFVSLERMISQIHNSFKPVFVGQFEKTPSGSTVLVGKFSIATFVKAFMTFAFGFCLLFILYSIALLANDPTLLAKGWYFPLFGIGMMVFFRTLVWLGKSSSDGDIPWLSNVIATAFSDSRDPATKLVK